MRQSSRQHRAKVEGKRNRGKKDGTKLVNGTILDRLLRLDYCGVSSLTVSREFVRFKLVKENDERERDRAN